MNNFYIAIDFDGTIAEHNYPLLGDPVPLALDYINEFFYHGAKIILWTMRHGKELGDAVNYVESSGIKLFGVNENPNQYSWTNSKKAYANIYIDDAAYGCPLIYPDGRRPYVDWSIVGPNVVNILKDNI